MDAESAKLLADAMNRLAVAIERLQSPGILPGGIHVHHHGIPAPTSTLPFYPNFTPNGPAYMGGHN